MTDKEHHILVVDDELSMRELLEYLFTKEGYRVDCAESGKQAIEMQARTPYDLIVSDIRLGDVTGLDVLRRPRPNTPISW